VANYTFETITPEQALAYDAQADSLTSGDGFFRPEPVWDDASGTLRLTNAGRSVTFGPGLQGETITAPGGLAVRVGSTGSDYLPSGSEVIGGAGDDVVSGGASAAYGGSGSDTFVASYVARITQILDWEVGDRIYMAATAPTAANYLETSTADENAARTLATAQFAQGKDYVVVAVGADLFLYGDYLNNNGAAPLSETRIVGRGLDDISVTNFIGGLAPADPQQPAAINGARGTISGNMDLQHLNSLLGADIEAANPSGLILNGAVADLNLIGMGLTYNADEQITGGLVTNIRFDNAVFHLSLDTRNLSAASFSQWVAADATQVAFQTTLAANDSLTGDTGADLLRGYDGDDTLKGMGGQDSLFGGAGNDFIYAERPEVGGIQLGVGPSFLRGEDGDDHIFGGANFDDANGNAGNDTVSTGAGDDWAVGGKDNDSLSGEAGGDVVWGNLGNDTQNGGDGNDQVRGGQGDDTITGGAGDDYVSGDRGNDTIAGGAGADLFHGSQDAGIDRAVDFHISEGDRVFLDPGTTYTVSQQGADTVIDMGGGHQMILVGVQLSTLTPGWIFGA
jgi:Ca2+-binding RTX toxin-like protein